MIRFLSGQINYGGRVTDDWDRRCLMTLIHQYICPETLSDEYAFSPSGQYKSLGAGTQKEYLVRAIDSHTVGGRGGRARDLRSRFRSV